MRRLGLLAVLAAALALAAPVAAAANNWTVVPGPVGGASLNGVSCPTFHSCMAVGDASAGFQALAESWNGRAWSIVPTAVLPPETTAGGLNAVSCVSDRFCAALGVQSAGGCVGPSCDEALPETWNGRQWSIVPGPGARGYFAQDVSCVTSGFCVNVGIHVRDGGSEEQRIQSWNGTEWSFVSAPEPPCTGPSCFGKEETLKGVSCVSTTFCVAVGWDDFFHGQFHNLVESWNGKEWSVVPSPNVPSLNGVGTFTELNGVSCVSVNRCVAVGQAYNSTLVESWDGEEWSILESPNPEGSNESKLNGVSCVRWGSCAAVGTDKTASGSQALVETSKGTKWSLAPSAKGAGAKTQLDRVSCAPILFLWQTCTAVGSTNNPEESPHSVVESSGIF